MNSLSLFLRRLGLHSLPLIASLLVLIGAPGSSRAIVLQDSDILISGGQLYVAGPGRLPTVVGSLEPEQGQVDSQGRIVFLAEDGSDDRIFRWNPTTGEREILFAGEMVLFDIALESDTSLVVSGSQGLQAGIFRIDFATGTATPLSIGGFLTAFQNIAVDPTNGDIVAVTGSAVVRIDPATGLQRPVVSAGFFNNSKVTVDPTGRIFVFNATGSVLSPFSRVDEDTQSLVPVGSAFQISDMVAEASGNLLVLGRDANLSGFTGLFRVDVDTGTITQFLPLPRATNVTIDSGGAIYASGFSGPGTPPLEERPGIVRIDPETAEMVALFYQPLGSSVQGAVVRADAAGEDELLVFTSSRGSGEIVRLDPRNGQVSLVTSGGLLSPAFVGPGPIVARSGEVVFLNDSTSSLLALRQNGTIRFLSAGNLLDDPKGVVEEAAGGTYLVASRGAVNPGLVRVTDAGVQSPVLPGDSPLRVREVALGRANDAVIRADSFPFELRGVDTNTGETIGITPLPPASIGRLAPARDGAPLVFATTSAFEDPGVFALNDADGSLQLLALAPGITSLSHLHAVPEAGSEIGIAAALLTLAWLARRGSAGVGTRAPADRASRLGEIRRTGVA